MSKDVLIVEDENKIARLLELELTHEGYSVMIANNGREGLDKALAKEWGLIILDIMLPELNGIEVLRRLRKVDIQTPVIVVSARNTTPEKISGLDQGANDYITKPFEIEELLARMRSSMRSRSEDSSNKATLSQLQINNLTVNKVSREIIREGRRIELTPKEYDLFVFLLENKNHAMSREQIINHVWGYDFVGDTNVVDVYIRYIRKKIDHEFDVNLIHTIWGVGYCVREENS
ncbi:response regulator transcription factor [Paenibacillus macquariensis]|uniref:DNA-binding response regulator, OmpR family, contains REC and winged-helix (WHTH) domain n=1 Tax=Paenibacillus macquariensis TaxID=948756 RepID=A0ABY1JPR5_9BACL|nr:response regulator transcription factor [Paenibacillus macquariensis]MEC0094032.1 response regulator transcription factor [Paenibacillus macquariensis]OAB37498.1 DNA-binding response regulator [Paenibacillus macquariensis subsp. macquariensis]SIQ54777.1 DNA-binding response regulator, OmpR family, contains REC and winged-helix (wHTH) domain [Paenibacillus macquariensis]